ncbi:MAG TPA: Ig-like domain-containing protein [Mycobacteriales bacterium]|nr:Ig-like domain-containing protein [Mycobacteriales bacterium]
MLDHGDRLTTGRLDSAAPTLVRLSALHPQAAAGEPCVLSARVVAVHESEPAPTGTVAFRAGHRLLGTAPLDDGGTARLDGVRLPIGVHALMASYGGDGDHAAATSAPVPQVVLAPARPVLVAVQEPALVPGGVLLRAELLDPESGRLVEEATGGLTFAVDGVAIGSAPLLGGEASLALGSLPAGRLSARFGGDVEHEPGAGEAPRETLPA